MSPFSVLLIHIGHNVYRLFFTKSRAFFQPPGTDSLRAPDGVVMGAPAVIQLIKCVYTRVVIFAGYVDEFQALADGDKKLLLNRNLDMLANIRLVTCFGADGRGDLARQWRAMGTCSEQQPGEQVRRGVTRYYSVARIRLQKRQLRKHRMSRMPKMNVEDQHL